MPYGTHVRGPIRVLYVDEDSTLGDMVGKALAYRGHELIHVQSSAAALARLAEGDIDVIALDHVLPGETGLDVLGRLGSRDHRPPVVYVDGKPDAHVAVLAIKSGADDYVIKDLSGEFFELLIAGVEQVYERWRLRRQKDEDEKAVREARDRAELLLHEVNHRVANSLGLVAAMVRMQATVLQDPVAVQALQETQARITAIAGVHRHLYTSARIGLVEIDDYLGHLVDELQGSLSDEDHPYQIRLEAERIAVSTDKAVSIGVIVGELVANAFKYAYSKGQSGEIRVKVATLDQDMARLSVEDDGQGFQREEPAQGTGLGRKILAALATNLRATLEQVPSSIGTCVRLDFPLD